MIVVLGIEFSLKKIEKVIGKNYKGYDVKYCAYESNEQLLTLVDSFSDDIDGVISNGLIMHQRLNSIGFKPKYPYVYINYDSALIMSYILDIIVNHSHIPIDKLYIDFFQMFILGSKSLYYLFPEKLRQQVKYFDFKGDISIRYDLVFDDIKQKYLDGEIELACIWHAGYEEAVKKLGIEYVMYDEMHFSQVKDHFNQLIIDIQQNQFKRKNRYVLTIQSQMLELIAHLLTSKGIEIFEKNQLMYCNIPSDNVYYDNNNLTCELCSVILDIDNACNIGIGEGRNDSESKRNSLVALKYAKTYGAGNCFLLTENKTILGPANSIRCLAISEYELNSIEKTAKELGIKAFNLCRVTKVFQKDKWIKTSDITNFLNIAPKSSNRILTALHENGYVIINKQKPIKAGRPELLYSLINNI